MAEHLARDQRRMKKPVVVRVIRPREIINKKSNWGPPRALDLSGGGLSEGRHVEIDRPAGIAGKGVEQAPARFAIIQRDNDYLNIARQYVSRFA